MSKHFLIINENGSDNIGDHAINEGLKILLKNHDYSFQTSFFSINKKSSLNQNAKNNNNFLRELKIIISKFKLLFQCFWYAKNKNFVNKVFENKKIDAVIIGGGQLILSSDVFPIAMYTWVKYANRYKIPIYIFGVGVGETFSFSDTILYKLSLKHAAKITVREYQSIKKLKNYFGIDAIFCPDLAFGISPLEKKQKMSGVIVGMTDFNVYKKYKNEINNNQFNNYEEYICAWVKKTKMLLKDSNEPIYLISTTNKDASCNRDLYKILKYECKNPIKLIDGVPKLIEYRKILSRCRIITSGRMHSLILGKIEGCEISPWELSCKIKYFIQNYNDKEPYILNETLMQYVSEF